MLELYHAGLTACSKKVRLCLREKEIDYIGRFVNINRFEQHKPEYLKLNPNGVVPTLVHDGEVIIESTVINEYLDDTFPDIPLRPKSLSERARMRVWAKISDEALAPNMVFAFTARGGMGDAAKQLDDATRAAAIDQFPLRDRRLIMTKIALGEGFNDDELATARQKAEDIVLKVERALQTGPYLAGSQYSLADINMIPFIDRYRQRILPDRLTPEFYPLTCDWHARIMARPQVQDTFRPLPVSEMTG